VLIAHDPQLTSGIQGRYTAWGGSKSIAIRLARQWSDLARTVLAVCPVNPKTNKLLYMKL